MSDRARQADERGVSETNPWLLRCRFPHDVGEIDCVEWRRAGRARRLWLQCGPAFAIPDEVADAPWAALAPGDLVCVRYIPLVSGARTVISVDRLDGRVCIHVSGAVTQRHTPERSHHKRRGRSA